MFSSETTNVKCDQRAATPNVNNIVRTSRKLTMGGSNGAAKPERAGRAKFPLANLAPVPGAPNGFFANGPGTRLASRINYRNFHEKIRTGNGQRPEEADVEYFSWKASEHFEQMLIFFRR